MNIKIGMYDFFAYTIPGGFYLLAIICGCAICGLVTIDLRTFDISLTELVAITVLAFVAGWVFDPVARTWYRSLPQESR